MMMTGETYIAKSVPAALAGRVEISPDRPT
jgi:hypothetical protein